MTAQQPPPQRPVQLAIPVSAVRAFISVAETVGAVYAAISASLGNGADNHHALIAALVAFIAHAVNHNAGGSPV